VIYLLLFSIHSNSEGADVSNISQAEASHGYSTVVMPGDSEPAADLPPAGIFQSACFAPMAFPYCEICFSLVSFARLNRLSGESEWI